MHERLINKISKLLEEEGYSNFNILEVVDHKIFIEDSQLIGYAEIEPKIEINFK